MFSCCLNCETETALSIIDPFDVTVELHKLTASQDSPAHKLEVRNNTSFDSYKKSYQKAMENLNAKFSTLIL